MATATGEFAFNFATAGDENPFVDPSFTDLLAGDAQIASGLLRQVGFQDYLMAYTGGTYDGGPVGASVEVNASGSGDEVLVGALDENGDGFLLRIRNGQAIVLVYTAYAIVDSNGSNAITLATDDLIEFTVTKGSPNSYAATQNGSPLTLSATTYTKSLSNLRAVWGHIAGNVGASAIKSLAVTDGLAVSGSSYTLPVEHSILAFTGQDVPFQLANIGTHGTLLLSGQDVTLTVTQSDDYILTVENGALTLTGQEVTFASTGHFTLPVAHGSLSLAGQAVALVYSGSVPLPSYVTNLIYGSVLFKVTKVYEVSSTGRTRWTNYIPVKFTTNPAVTPNYFGGAVAVDSLSDVTGLVEWVDYIPVVAVSDDDSGAWRTDNNGFIPLVEIT